MLLAMRARPRFLARFQLEPASCVEQFVVYLDTEMLRF